MGIYGVYMKILFIKSTSIQHLALSFEKVRSLPPLNPLLIKEGRGVVIDVLAHPHAVDSLKGFGFINRIISYNSTGNFSPLHIFREYIRNIRRGKYDMVIVPFNNMSGSGYENVMALAVCTGARHIVTCNKIGEIERLTFKDSLLRAVRGYLYYPFAILMTVVLSVMGIVGVLLSLVISNWRKLPVAGDQ